MAKAFLTEAWETDKTREEAPDDMLTVCKGLSLDRAEMEKWFERAMKANPNCTNACIRKLDYLQPKWHGSMEEMLAFCWQCARSGNAEGQIVWVPVLFLASEAPILGQRFEAERDAVRKYFGHPIMWQLVATTCEQRLAHEPEDAYVRSMYARMACIAGKYDVANREFDRLGDNYWVYVFESKREYEYFRKWAKDKSPPPPGG